MMPKSFGSPFGVPKPWCAKHGQVSSAAWVCALGCIVGSICESKATHLAQAKYQVSVLLAEVVEGQQSISTVCEPHGFWVLELLHAVTDAEYSMCCGDARMSAACVRHVMLANCWNSSW
jgi:hypothetical protein